MALRNKSFTFVECTDCGKTIKIEVGKDILEIRCNCKDTVVKIVEDVKPKPRSRPKKVEDATNTI